MFGVIHLYLQIYLSFSEVKRCEEMERKLRFIEVEVIKEDLTVQEVSYSNLQFY